tara:strand:- start:187 stop:420 length:234 start_codon:yes stop_codon:yes gene_type:complete
MLISDLKKTCHICRGTGFQAGYDEWGSIKTNLKKSCHDCSGKGYILSSLGENMWELYCPMIKELIREELQEKVNLIK